MIALWIQIVLGWGIVAFGQPAWSTWLSPLAACLGYALFWNGVTKIPFSKTRFWGATLWFTAVQAVQLSWMTSVEFHGAYILLVYLALAIWLGLQFGLVTLFVDKIPMCATAAFWTLLEWARHYVLCGFSWNPVGLTLTAFVPSLQAASLFGILGLSFLVFLTNLAVWKQRWTVAVSLAIFPYAFGFVQILWHQGGLEQSSRLSVGLVQTGLLPSEKLPLGNRLGDFIPPVEQWRRIVHLLKEKPVVYDLIVLPEFAVPFSAHQNAYPVEAAEQVLGQSLGGNRLKISNADWAQAIGQMFRADLIAGLQAEEQGLHYSSAFFYPYQEGQVERYDKQILVPLAEYVPFEWVKMLTQPYGITEFFTHGKQCRIFSSKTLLSASICYEETFAHLMRKNRVKGSTLFVNLTNDNWYPDSKLAKQHFDHARIRTVENGIPLVRACNTGFTAALDCLGQTVGQIVEERRSEVLAVQVPTYHFATLYSLWGDWGIITLSILLLAVCFCLGNKRWYRIK